MNWSEEQVALIDHLSAAVNLVPNLCCWFLKSFLHELNLQIREAQRCQHVIMTSDIRMPVFWDGKVEH
jgi:hypothetical protein